MTEPAAADAFIIAPWAPEQVAALNRFQREGGMHPFTCPHDHPDEAVLTAHPDGWHCPDHRCGYHQDWAHAFMAQPDTWPKAFADLREAAAAELPGPTACTGEEGFCPEHGYHRHPPINAEQSPRTTPDNPATSSDAPDNPLREPIAAADCGHVYAYSILGGHPISVGICMLCHTPNWDDLMRQAEGLYRWGWTEGSAGQPARATLSAYDQPRSDEPAAHDDGPDVAEAAAHDRLWPLQKGGE